MLRLTDIRKTYSIGSASVDVLRGVSLEVNRGDFLSIVGGSGTGKSTLMNILGLLDRPTAGSYMLNDRDVSDMDDNEISRLRNASIGFIFQAFHLLPRLTAADNVGLPLVYRGVAAKEIRLRSRGALEKVGLGDRANHRPNELSGGQQQRVAIARALVGEPAMVLADEPTGALDPDTGRDVMRLLHELNAQEELTVIIITHDPAVAQQCPRRTRIEGGVLNEVGARLR